MNQENLIQSTDPDPLQVSTKDVDSTLSKASRAFKKTSKKVTAHTHTHTHLLLMVSVLKYILKGHIESKFHLQRSLRPHMVMTL